MTTKLQLRIGLKGSERVVEIEVPTQDGDDDNNISITTPDGTELAGISFSQDIWGPVVVLGHWPDGEEWVNEGGVTLPLAETTEV